MNPYLTIALIGLLLKIWAGFRLHQYWRFGADRVWLLLFLIAAYAQAVIEITGYLFLLDKSAEIITVAMHGYYLTFTLIIVIFPFSVSTIIRNAIHPLFVASAIVVIALFTHLLISTPLIVEGYERTQYAVTRIPGDYYWVFQAMAITMIILCVSLLAQSYRYSNSELIRIKSANLLIGFIPFGIIITCILVGLRMGSTFTAAGILPLLVSIYVVVLAENLRDDRLLDLRAYLPWTRKARLLRRLAAPMRRTGLNHEEVRELAELYRRTLEHQNRRTRLSKAADTSPSSVREFGPPAAKHAPRH